MGTRINVLMDHSIPDPRHRVSVLARIAPTLGEVVAVAEYWQKNDPECRSAPAFTWSAWPEQELLPPTYEGPGGLWLAFGTRAARVHTTARWRGFLSIEELRWVHLAAFRAIAAALGSHRLVFYPDDEFIDEAVFQDGASVDECIALMRKRLGKPQHSVERMHPAVARQTDDTVPRVWFVDTLISTPVASAPEHSET